MNICILPYIPYIIYKNMCFCFLLRFSQNGVFSSGGGSFSGMAEPTWLKLQ
jgi:hypothetical protein